MASSNSIILSSYLPIVPINNMSQESSFQCTEGFYRNNSSGICLPSCYGDWIEYTRATSVAIDVIIITTAFTGFVVAVVTLIISISRREKM